MGIEIRIFPSSPGPGNLQNLTSHSTIGFRWRLRFLGSWFTPETVGGMVEVRHAAASLN
jgi:hypothetical protein